MELELWARSYRTFGSLPSCQPLAHLFNLGGADFGPGIRKIEITFLFAHSGTPVSTLEEIFVNFHRYRAQELPKITFRRSRQAVVIDVATDLIDGKRWEKTQSLPLERFRSFAGEIVQALELLRKPVKGKDDFRLDEFLAHCRSSLDRMPATGEELAALTSEAAEAWQRRRAAMSAWEVLDIDWRDYHPAARELLDDPFFWDCADEFAPHGNDAGADLLEDYRKWLKRHPNVDPLEFHLALLDSWGYDPTSNEELYRSEFQDAAVALAFAELKLRGSCRQTAQELAMEVLDEQQKEAEEARDWEHRAARLAAIAKNRAALQRAPIEPNDD